MLSTNKISLDYDDITLISRQISTVKSRDDIDTSMYLFPEVKLTIPIIASPMVDVVNVEVAIKLRHLGGFAFLHRFCSVDEQVDSFIQVRLISECGCAIGLDEYYRLESLYNVGCRYFVLDVANGANYRVNTFLESVDKQYKDIYFIVGNVVSEEQYRWCSDLPNVYGVRVGVGGGKSCTTRKATGIFNGAISLLSECRKVVKKNIIADGGIKSPAEFCKALAFANFVMLGSQIASVVESPAKIIYDFKTGKLCKSYNGSSSFNNQLLYKEKPKYIEGKEILLEYKGESLEDLVNRFSEGLRSSMSYFSAYNLEEFKNNIDYLIILNNK